MTKDEIDQEFQHPTLRRLLYWKYGNDPDCHKALQELPGTDYSAGSQQFANDVIELLSFICSPTKENFIHSQFERIFFRLEQVESLINAVDLNKTIKNAVSFIEIEEIKEERKRITE